MQNIRVSHRILTEVHSHPNAYSGCTIRRSRLLAVLMRAFEEKKSRAQQNSFEVGRARPLFRTAGGERNSDRYEQEAERVAAQVTPMRDPRSVESSLAYDLNRFKIHPDAGGASRQAGIVPAVGVPGSLGFSGQPMDAVTRSFMEARFGVDFGHVRVHTDGRAAESARAADALAYTVGPNVVFADSQFAPDTAVGQRLLAHELTHVVQQTGATRPDGGGRVTRPTEAQPRVELFTAPRIQRYAHEKCSEDVLKSRIWPCDHDAKNLVDNAISRLSNPDGVVRELFDDYFMTKKPKVDPEKL